MTIALALPRIVQAGLAICAVIFIVLVVASLALALLKRDSVSITQKERL